MAEACTGSSGGYCLKDFSNLRIVGGEGEGEVGFFGDGRYRVGEDWEKVGANLLCLSFRCLSTPYCFIASTR